MMMVKVVASKWVEEEEKERKETTWWPQHAMKNLRRKMGKQAKHWWQQMKWRII